MIQRVSKFSHKLIMNPNDANDEMTIPEDHDDFAPGGMWIRKCVSLLNSDCSSNTSLYRPGCTEEFFRMDSSKDESQDQEIFFNSFKDWRI